MDFPKSRFLRIDLQDFGFSLTLQGIGQDFKASQGLCGNFDGNPTNDLFYVNSKGELLNNGHDIMVHFRTWR